MKIRELLVRWEQSRDSLLQVSERCRSEMERLLTQVGGEVQTPLEDGRPGRGLSFGLRDGVVMYGAESRPEGLHVEIAEQCLALDREHRDAVYMVLTIERQIASWLGIPSSDSDHTAAKMVKKIVERVDSEASAERTGSKEV